MTSLDSARPTPRRLDSVFLPPAKAAVPAASTKGSGKELHTRTRKGPHVRGIRRLPHVRLALKWAAIAVCAYIVTAPFLPMVGYNVKVLSPSAFTLLSPRQGQTNEAVPGAVSGIGNRLAIDTIDVDGEILEGKSAYVLDKGIWHRPGTSTPELGGNTVLTAHRFKYLSGKNTFYHLDKLKPGDTIRVTWNNKTYDYAVTDTRVVSPSDTGIEQPTDRPTLTLYTCTPLWTSKNRLVVRAERAS